MAGAGTWMIILGLYALYSLTHAQELQVIRFSNSTEFEVRCLLGYFESSTGDLEHDCCHYYQCVDHGNSAYVRTCMYPTVWNIATCSCDHRFARPDCENTPDSCYDEPLADTNCSSKTFDPDLNECCINGDVYTSLDPNVGYMKFGERFPTFCSDGLHFDLEECGCVNGELDNETDTEDTNPDCLHWGFDLDFSDDLKSTWVNRGSLRFRGPGVLNTKAYIEASGGQPGFIPYFTKVDLGSEITISVWYRTQIFEGFLFDNFDDRDGESTLEFSLQQASEINGGVPPDLPEVQNDELIREESNIAMVTLGSGRPMEIQLPGNGVVQNDDISLTNQSHSVWNNVIVVLKDQVIKLYNNGSFIGEGVDEDETAHGNRLPLAIGRNYRGDLDELIVCRYAWTANQVERYVENGKIPKGKNGDRTRKKKKKDKVDDNEDDS
ncbi:unnamed protein product [Owenia fusiformis]|uniref:Uncharacterized protein n=1 Tax=Owenia fusiformis TaxID=6347 RepID=A0A8J1T887_OWEFU|nr:unnamed protein product [Owenia fusiformis]